MLGTTLTRLLLTIAEFFRLFSILRTPLQTRLFFVLVRLIFFKTLLAHLLFMRLHRGVLILFGFFLRQTRLVVFCRLGAPVGCFLLLFRR